MFMMGTRKEEGLKNIQRIERMYTDKIFEALTGKVGSINVHLTAIYFWDNICLWILKFSSSKETFTRIKNT